MPRTVDLLIANGTILTLDQAMHIIPNGIVAIKGSKIVAVEESSQLSNHYIAHQTLDASGMIVIPGLINTHTHGGDVLFRGLVEDEALGPWLEKLMLAESNFLNRDTIYWGSMLAYIEMILAGITTAVDMFWDAERMAEAAKKLGFRLATGEVYIDSSAMDGIDIHDRASKACEFIQAYRNDELIIPCVAAHGVYTVSQPYLQEAGEIAKENDVLFVTHASETVGEVQNSLRDFGLTPIRHLDRLGVLGQRTILAHCVHLQDDEFDLLSERGVVVSHCPVSNLKLASGIANIGKMLQAGVKVTLGTDGAVSGNDLNIWMTLRLTTILQKAMCNDPSLLPAEQVLSMATREAAAGLGMGDRLGSIEPGKLADIVLVRTNRPHAIPSYNPYSSLIYSIGREDVKTVLINGKIVVYQGQVVTIEEQEVIHQVERIARQIGQFMKTDLSNKYQVQKN